MATHVLSWLALEESLAWGWFLIAWPLFAGWPDRGFGVSKAAGVLTLATAAWALAWLAGTAITPRVCWELVALIIAVAGLCGRRQRRAVADFLSIRVRCCVAAEGVWLVTTAVFLLLRAMNPRIEGGEKFMDFAFLNAALRSLTVPIEDPWLAGFSLNYYHFGFFTWATLARMLGTPPGVAYNLAVGMVPGLVAACAYSIGLVLTRSRRLAVASATALVALGNLAGARQIAQVGGAYDIWSPTRVIPGTINEFPFFTFIWGDLHPHLMAMPNFLIFVALALVAFEDRDSRGSLEDVGIFACLGASAGIAAVTSPWDVVCMALVLATVLVARVSEAGPRQMALEVAAFVAIALAIALPAARSADAGGLSAGLGATHSPLGAFLLVQGTWMLPGLCLLALVVVSTPRPRWVHTSVALATLLAGVLSGSVTLAALTLITILSWELLWRSRPTALFLIAPAMSMLLIAELFYVDDIFGPSLARVNTVFKFHLDAILLMALVSSMCARAVWEGVRSAPLRRFGAVSLGTAAFLAGIYPLGAVGALLSAGAGHRRPTLDGTEYLQQAHPGDAAAIDFLTREVRDRPVIAEATGEAYSYAARISAYTGLPAVLGWANHERVWRRSATASAEIDRRIVALRTVYEGDLVQTTDVLRRFGVRYVVVGDLERLEYPQGNFGKFDVLGRRVFDQGGTALFEIGGTTKR